nr:hypothetical protein HUO10_006148 [Paraburkholderia busanensis]
MSLRPQNHCNSCSYTWFPRGKHRSLRCPGCGGSNVEIVQRPVRSSSGCGPVVLVAVLVIVAIIWATSHSGSDSSASVATAASEPIGMSAEGASEQSATQSATKIGNSPDSTASDAVIAASETVDASDSAALDNQGKGAASDVTITTDKSGSQATYVTSFDCSKATQQDEAAICSDPGLAAMDVELAELYQSALKSISDPKALVQSESGWVTARHLCDRDLECLRRAYGARIGQFKGSLGSPPLIPAESDAEKPNQ